MTSFFSSCRAVTLNSALASAAIASPAWGQSEMGEQGPVTLVRVAAATDVGISVSGARDYTVPEVITQQQTGRVNLSVNYASDLIGTPTAIVREQLGDEVATASYSSNPVIMIGGGPIISNSPLANLRITSRFGSRRHPIDGVRRQHAGVDYGAAHGTPIMATGDATVTHAGSAGGYGLMVNLDHGAGLETRYAHMSRIAVSVGDRVTNGQVIGYVGSTGRSTGSHLHYETRVNGRAVDPLNR